MGRKSVWRDEHLWNLLNLSVKELLVLYPDYKKGTIKGKIGYWNKQIAEGKVQMPPKPEQEPTVTEGQLYKTWEVSAFNHQTSEWETTTNHGYEFKPDPQALAEVFEPAIQARITPTRRKRVQELGRTLLVFGDSQIGYHRVYDQEGNDSLIPTHSEEALSVLTQINAQVRPHEIINLSDTVDFAEFSRFEPDSDSFHRTLGPALQRAHNLYAQLKADNPDAKITEVDSNHTARVHKHQMRKMPELYGLVLPGEDYPLMSYYRLANLAPLGVNFISGYGSAEYLYNQELGNPIVFKHGVHSSSNPGATVKKESVQNPTVNVVRGHGHSGERVAQTTRDGQVLNYIQLGTTCQTTGSVPSYHSSMDDFGHPVHHQENWQQELMLITDNEGQYTFDTISIINGIAFHRGVRYDGNE